MNSTETKSQTQREKIGDGGPAFPVTSGENDGASLSRDFDGISIRDYFAAKAMQSFIFIKGGEGLEYEDGVAKSAYDVADAMLAARKAGAR